MALFSFLCALFLWQKSCLIGSAFQLKSRIEQDQCTLCTIPTLNECNGKDITECYLNKLPGFLGLYSNKPTEWLRNDKNRAFHTACWTHQCHLSNSSALKARLFSAFTMHGIHHSLLAFVWLELNQQYHNWISPVSVTPCGEFYWAVLLFGDSWSVDCGVRNHWSFTVVCQASSADAQKLLAVQLNLRIVVSTLVFTRSLRM